MAQAKALITDYIGTLANAQSYSLEASMAKLHSALVDEGFDTDKKEFLDAYARAHEKYRLVRYGELREVTNAVWVSETLRNLGHNVFSDDSRMNVALNVFFQDYVDTLKLRPYAKQLLKKTVKKCKLGLISNFTYAPVVYASLRKLSISQFFNAIVVSGNNGWRKPHRKIFEETLARLQVKAEEAVYIGDCPMEDINGATEAGIKAVFVSSQFYNAQDLQASQQKPALVTEDLKEICRDFSEITTL